MTGSLIRGERALVVGRAGMDFYADPPGARIVGARQFSTALGGSAANIATGLVKLGARADLLGAVSDDAVGRFVLAELDRYGVGRAHVRLVGGGARTSLAVVESRAEDCQSVIYRNDAADFHLAPADADAVSYAAHDVVIVTGTSLAVEPSRAACFLALERARASGLARVLDVDHRPYSWSGPGEAARVLREAAALCPIVIGNDVEFTVMAEGGDGLALAAAMASPDRLIVYKMGAAGAIAFCEDRAFEAGIYPVTPLKPTGAGDAFMAGLLTALMRGVSVETAVLRGAAAAAITVTRVGCAPAMPDRVELDAFIARETAPTIRERH